MYCLSTSEAGDGLLNGEAFDTVQDTPLGDMLNPAIQPLLWLPQVRVRTQRVAKRACISSSLTVSALHPQHRMSAIRNEWLAPGKKMFPGDIPTRYALDVFRKYSLAAEQRRRLANKQNRARTARARYMVANNQERHQMQASRAAKRNRPILKPGRMQSKRSDNSKKPKRGGR